MANTAKKKGLFGDDLPDTNVTDAKFIAGKGASSPWFADLLGLDRQVVNKKLANCPRVGSKTSGYLYQPSVALPYLIEPIVDLEEWFDGLGKKDLPEGLRKEHWAGKIEKLKYGRLANELYHARDVAGLWVLIFRTIKDEFQTAPTEIEKDSVLSDEQIALFSEHLDKIMLKIKTRVLTLVGTKTTPSILADFEDTDFVMPSPHLLPAEEFLSANPRKNKN